MNKQSFKIVKEYLTEFSDLDDFPLIYKGKKLRIYETFIGLNNDGSSILSEDSRTIALLADKLFYNETLTDIDVLNVIKYSKELENLKSNLIEFATNEIQSPW